MLWEECLRREIARKSTKDKELANSLLKMSERRISFIEKINIDDLNAPIILTECYEALREVCEAILAVKGYKVYSHECITSFLKEILKEEILAEEFDRYRRIRNLINYYGISIAKEEAVKGFEEIRQLINKLQKHVTDK